MNKKRTDLRGIMRGIEQGIFAGGILIAAIERFAPAPSSAAHDFDIVLNIVLDYEIRSIRDQLAIDAID